MMESQPTYCRITDDLCSSNGQKIHNTQKLPAQQWFRFLFDHLELEYPKFHKMDGLSKLGFLGVEFLKTVESLPTETDEIAVVFVNKHSSLDADLSHQEQIEKGSASPAIFVYTLPNIVLGEIAIRNKWYGEQQFFIKNEWPHELIHEYIVTIFELNKANRIIIGYVDYFQEKTDGKWVILTQDQFNNEKIREEINTFFDK